MFLSKTDECALGGIFLMVSGAKEVGGDAVAVAVWCRVGSVGPRNCVGLWRNLSFWLKVSLVAVILPGHGPTAKAQSNLCGRIGPFGLRI